MTPDFAQAQHILVAQADPNKPTVDWTTAFGLILAALAGSVVTAFAGLNKVIAAWWARMARTVEKGKINHAAGARRIAAVYQSIEQMGTLEGVDRIIVFTGTNCGGVPDPKKPYTVRPLYRWSTGTNNGLGRAPDDIYKEDLRVDAHYMKVVVDLIERKWCNLKTSDLPADAMMKRYLTKEAVFQSRLFQLHLDEVQLTWLSVASYNRDFTDSELDDINIVVDRIRTIMSSDE